MPYGAQYSFLARAALALISASRLGCLFIPPRDHPVITPSHRKRSLFVETRQRQRRWPRGDFDTINAYAEMTLRHS